MPTLRVFLMMLVLPTACLVTPTSYAQTYTVLYSFQGAPDGNGPSNLTKGANGYFYGITSSGGDATCNPPQGCGTIFRIKGTQESVVSRFPAYFEADFRSLMFHTGALYGTTDGGGDLNCIPPYGCGTVFKADLSGNLTALYTFTEEAVAAMPQGPLVADAAGNLYGTTDSGGSPDCGNGTGCGIVFKLDPTGTLSSLHAFGGGAGGAYPSTTFASGAGNFYGTVSQGGDVNCQSAFGGGCGLVYKVNQKGKFTVLHTFTGGSDGAENEHTGPLVRDAAGSLYGTTPLGGGGGCFFGKGCGTVFKIDAAGQYSVLYRFTGGTDGGYGEYTSRGLALDTKTGNLYGATELGGDPVCQCGTVFKLDPTGKLTVLHTFLGGVDGSDARQVVWDGAGHLYGVATAGGAFGHGIVFRVTP